MRRERDTAWVNEYVSGVQFAKKGVRSETRCGVLDLGRWAVAFALVLIVQVPGALWGQSGPTIGTFPAQWQKTPVCSNFNANASSGTAIVAEAQAQPPSTDIYINTRTKIWKEWLTQSTILHEALHNLSGLNDSALAEILGTSLTATGATNTINKVLVKNGCAGN